MKLIADIATFFPWKTSNQSFPTPLISHLTPLLLVMSLLPEIHILASEVSLKVLITQSESDKILKSAITLYWRPYIGPQKRLFLFLLTSATTSILNIQSTSDRPLLMITFTLVSDQSLWKAHNWKEVVSSLPTLQFLQAAESLKIPFGPETQFDLSKIWNQLQTELHNNKFQLSELLSNDPINSYRFRTTYCIEFIEGKSMHIINFKSVFNGFC